MEKEYFYLNGDVKIGPLSLDALKSAPISRTTFVWNNSLPDWVEACSLPELAELFVSIAPPPPATNYNSNSANNYSTGGNFNNPEKPPMPENYLVWAILSTVLCCWPIGIFSIINAAKVGSAYNAGDYQGALKASANAKKLAIVTVVAGAIIVIIVGIFYTIAGIAYFGALDL